MIASSQVASGVNASTAYAQLVPPRWVVGSWSFDGNNGS
jgi:hypothetical protein